MAEGEGGLEVKLLEDDADFLAAVIGELLIGEVGEVGAIYDDLSGGGRLDAADELQYSGFAGAAGAGEGDEGGFFDGEADVAEGGYFSVLDFVLF